MKNEEKNRHKADELFNKLMKKRTWMLTDEFYDAVKEVVDEVFELGYDAGRRPHIIEIKEEAK